MTTTQILIRLYCPFHCTRLYQCLRRGLIVHDSIFLLSVHHFAFSDHSPGLFHLVSVEDKFSSSHPMTSSYSFSWDFPTRPYTFPPPPPNSFLKKIQRNLCPKNKTENPIAHHPTKQCPQNKMEKNQLIKIPKTPYRNTTVNFSFHL